MTITIYKGDCRERLKSIPDKTFHTVVTSPPYWGLRDYGTATWIGGDPNCPHMRTTKVSKNTITGHKTMFEQGSVVGDAIFKTICPLCGAVRQDSQLGVEETPQEYVANMVQVFREVKRVLRDDGTLWLNLGDTYYNYRADGKYPKQTVSKTKQDLPEFSTARGNKLEGLKSKDLIGIPWRVAFALQEDGWYLRQDIIWHKPNPMPESVKDRCTKSHEYIFLFSKSKNYYFDNESIKEKSTESSVNRLSQNIENQKGSSRVPNKTNGNMFAVGDEMRNKRSVWTMDSKYKDDEQEREHRQGMSKTRGDKLVVTRPKLPSQENFVKYIKSKTNVDVLTDYTGIKKSTIEHWFRLDKTGFSYPSRDDWMKVSTLINDNSDKFNKINEMMTHEEYHYDEIVTSDTRNKRSVWTVTTKPYKEAHFATYPPDLIEPCILAGCPDKVCKSCGTPYEKIYDSKKIKRNELDPKDSRYRPNNYEGAYKDINGKGDAGYNITNFVGYKQQCNCTTKETEGGHVLDPFGGAGTTALVSDRLKRHSSLIELNDEYATITEKRLREDGGMFIDIQYNNKGEKNG